MLGALKRDGFLEENDQERAEPCFRLMVDSNGSDSCGEIRI